jgi:hypothetical protein
VDRTKAQLELLAQDTEFKVLLKLRSTSMLVIKKAMRMKKCYDLFFGEYLAYL